MTDVKIKFEAFGTPDTVDTVCQNFSENYPEFSCSMSKTDYSYDKKTKEFMLLWEGPFDDEKLNEDDINTLIRLTHHGEGFYDMTDAEFVHIEVYINGKWYGK